MRKLRAMLRSCAVVALLVATASCGDTASTGGVLEPQLATVTAGKTTYTRIEEQAPNSDVLSLSKVVGLLGGTLNVAHHSLTVPFGAVTVPTLFTFTHVNNGYVEVEATATITDLLGNVIDVGASGFNEPVTVTLTYARATNVVDPSRLKIIWLKPNGRHEIVPSTVDTKNKTVSAKLDHFSRYAMVSD